MRSPSHATAPSSTSASGASAAPACGPVMVATRACSTTSISASARGSALPAPAPPGRRPRSPRRRGAGRPSPGSLVSTRSRRLRRGVGAVGDDDLPGVERVPDARRRRRGGTLTQDAPFTALTSAFRIGQSAIASEPSFIASVSRLGEATEPQSRWSRPMTIGAFTLPLAHQLVERRARLARARRSRASRCAPAAPGTSRARCASSIQRRRSRLSGTRSSTARSVTGCPAGSPESATQRNGPLPSQKSGRM